MIVGLSGYATAGKDAAADALVERAGFVKRSFADALREVAYACDPIIGHKVHEGEYEPGRFGPTVTPIRWAETFDDIGYHEMKVQYPEVRRFLQLMGTEAGRNILGDSIWVDTAMRRATYDDLVVFADVRFPNEATAIVEAGGVTIRVERPGVGPANDHPSETSLDGWNFDHEIVNDSTLDALGDAIMEVIAKHRR